MNVFEIWMIECSLYICYLHNSRIKWKNKQIGKKLIMQRKSKNYFYSIHCRLCLSHRTVALRNMNTKWVLRECWSVFVCDVRAKTMNTFTLNFDSLLFAKLFFVDVRALTKNAALFGLRKIVFRNNGIVYGVTDCDIKYWNLFWFQWKIWKSEPWHEIGRWHCKVVSIKKFICSNFQNASLSINYR